VPEANPSDVNARQSAPALARATGELPGVSGLCLVTGGTGFVGSAVASALAGAGAQVRVLARAASDRRNLDGLPVEVATGDLRDRASLERALEGCRYLFHVAADYRLWVPDPAAMLAANVEGTRAVMEAALAAGVERVVHTSSVATLGHNADGSPADEATPSAVDDMVGPYKRSKFLAEAEVRRLVAERGLPAVIVHPSAPIGPGDRKPTPTGRMVVEAAAGRAPAYIDTGLNVVHVGDVARGHLLALSHGRIGERYILGGDNLTLAAILSMCAEAGGKAPPRIRLPIGAVMPVAVAAEAFARLTGKTPLVTRDELAMARTPMFFTSAKAERELGYAHRPAAEAIRDAVAWFRANGYLR
jgi:dihydroflavonol-4-reductase